MKPYYDEDGITIYHGDALEIMPALPIRTVNAVVTDPPYIIGAVSHGHMESKSGGWADMMNSALWFSTWYQMVDRLLRLDGVFWTCCNWRSLPVVMRGALDAGLPITSVAVWDKMWIGPGGSQGLRPSYELVALLCRPDYSIPDRGVPDVLPAPPALPRRAEVVVIGGGITGVALLDVLRRRDVDVVLLERDHLAAGASGRNAGFPSAVR